MGLCNLEATGSGRASRSCSVILALIIGRIRHPSLWLDLLILVEDGGPFQHKNPESSVSFQIFSVRLSSYIQSAVLNQYQTAPISTLKTRQPSLSLSHFLPLKLYTSAISFSPLIPYSSLSSFPSKNPSSSSFKGSLFCDTIALVSPALRSSGQVYELLLPGNVIFSG